LKTTASHIFLATVLLCVWNNLSANQVPADSVKIFWGEFHAHSGLSFDASGSTDTMYVRARRDMKLDIVGVTDHDHLSTDAKWQASKDAANKYYEPGKFVTLIGYEWTQWETALGGHRTVFFPGSDPPRFPYFDSSAMVSMNLSTLIESLRKAGGIAIIAHPDAFTPADISYQDREVQVGVEFFGFRGRAFEYFGNPDAAPQQYVNRSARNGLLAGGILGSYAVSDNHSGMAGVGGLTAVLADTLTREAVFRAMKKRRVYATTGPRVLLSFRSDSLLMGDEAIITKNPRRFQVNVSSPDTIQSVTIVRNNTEIIIGENVGQLHFATTYTDFAPLVSRSFYYVRVNLRNGHRVWSTPIFFNKIDTNVASSRGVPTAGTLEVFPNPSNGYVNVRYLLLEKENAEFALFDILGRRVAGWNAKAMVNRWQETQFDLHHLPVGVYFLQLKTPTVRQIQKVLLLK